MLAEISLKQQEDQMVKCWFQDDYFDLFTWQNETSQITSFQLCYDRLNNERVISWDNERGFGHHRVDDGESSPHKNMSPVFIKEEGFLYHEVMSRFLESSTQINQEIRSFVQEKLDEYAKNNPYKQ